MYLDIQRYRVRQEMAISADIKVIAIGASAGKIGVTCK